MHNADSLDGLVILDNVQSYNLFQHVNKDREQGADSQSGPQLDSVDYLDQDLLPGDDPGYEETDNNIVDDDKISIGFKVDKTSDTITLLEKDRTQSINRDISDLNIPEEEKIKLNIQDTIDSKLSSQNKNATEKSKVDQEKRPL